MTAFLTDAGYWALIIFAFAQACCIPISSEITFGFAGVLAYEGHLSLALVIVIGSLAEFAGSFTAYGLGRKGGRDAVERYRRYVLMTRRDVERAEKFFAGRGAWAVAVGRVIPLVRAFTGLVAGLVEVPVGPFAIFNAIGTVVWATALTLIGYALGNDWTKASKTFSRSSDALAVAVILVLAALIAHKWHQVRKERRSDAANAEFGSMNPMGLDQAGKDADPSNAAASRARQDKAGPNRVPQHGRHRADSKGG